MYKFQSERPRKSNAIDGFISSRPRRPRPQSLVDNSPSQDMILRPQRNALDDFKKPDGFRGRTVPRLSPRGDFADVVPMHRNNQRVADLSSLKKAPKKRTRRKLKIFAKVTLIMLAAIVLVVGFIFGKAWWSAHKVFKGTGPVALAFQKDVDPHLLNGEGDGRVNILLLGKGGEYQPNGSELTDSIMIASLDPINTSVTLLSVPRDLWVKPDGLWPMKINAVYASAKEKALNSNPDNKDAAEAAGLGKIADIVEEYLGVHMHYYGLIEFSAFQEAVNTIGGIDVVLPEAYYDGTMLVGNKYLNLPAGSQHMDGGIALAYARSRYGAARGDFDRGGHQQIVLMGIKDKVLSIGTYANPIKISQLLSTFGNRVQTNLSIDDIMRVYAFAKELDQKNVTHADLATPPDAVVKTGVINEQSVVMPRAGINDFLEVQKFVRNKLKDGFIIKESPSIIVLNGTNKAGLAQTKADELKSYGYNVTKVADAPSKNQTANAIVDNTNDAKKYTKRYLEQRLNATAVSTMDGMDLSLYVADFIIIIGSQ